MVQVTTALLSGLALVVRSDRGDLADLADLGDLGDMGVPGPGQRAICLAGRQGCTRSWHYATAAPAAPVRSQSGR